MSGVKNNNLQKKKQDSVICKDGPRGIDSDLKPNLSTATSLFVTATLDYKLTFSFYQSDLSFLSLSTNELVTQPIR